jgi:DNA-binding response OmpR family regulator
MGHEPSLLVVEDETLHRIIFAKAAQKLGFRVQLAKDPAEAIAALQARDCTCILLDLMLGSGSGEEVLCVVADLAVKPSVILISGATEEVVRDTVAFWGQNGVTLLGPLRKPANMLEISALLEQVLDAAAPVPEAVDFEI